MRKWPGPPSALRARCACLGGTAYHASQTVIVQRRRTAPRSGALRTTRAIAFARRSAPATRTARSTQRASCRPRSARPQADRRARATPIARPQTTRTSIARAVIARPSAPLPRTATAVRPVPGEAFARLVRACAREMAPSAPLAVRTATAPTGSARTAPRTRPRAFAPRGRVWRRATLRSSTRPGARRTGRATTGR